MIGFEDAPFGLPSFVRERPEPYQSAGLIGQFVFWHPEKTGNEALDHAYGRQHLQTALTFARAIQSGQFLACVFGDIIKQELGMMEYGFINALSTKATYGRLPSLITEDETFALFNATGITEDEAKYSEREALEYLILARETRCPEVIESLLASIAHREMERGSLSFFWTVCGAAYLGALN